MEKKKKKEEKKEGKDPRNGQTEQNRMKEDGCNRPSRTHLICTLTTEKGKDLSTTVLSTTFRHVGHNPVVLPTEEFRGGRGRLIFGYGFSRRIGVAFDQSRIPGVLGADAEDA